MKNLARRCLRSPATVRTAAWSAVLCVLLGACAHGTTGGSAGAARSTATPWAASTSTFQWNEYGLELIARNAVGQFPALRTLAYLNLAINNAIVQASAQGLEPDGAASGAAAGVLMHLFPKDEQAIAARLQREMQAIGDAPRARFQSGVDIGRQVAAQVVTLAQADRASVPWSGTVPVGDDKWSSRQQPPAPPLGPNLGSIRPFFLTSAADYRAPPPPAFGSEAFQAQVRQVRAVADARSNAQLRIAQYWENLGGSFAAGAWNAVARSAIAARGLDEASSARTLALMHMAAFDANLACHDSKYVYWVPRPTQADPKITLAIGVPNHPSYPSNHACISGAIGLVLDATLPGTDGRYEAMGQQAGESRVYAGIHYRMDLDAGFEIARKVAARALEVGLPKDKPFMPQGR
jgi:PAP2 superfamily protein